MLDFKQNQADTKIKDIPSKPQQIDANLRTPQITEPSNQNPLNTQEEKKEQDVEENNFNIFFRNILENRRWDWVYQTDERICLNPDSDK